MNEHQPKIPLQVSFLDKILIGVGAAIIVATWIYIGWIYKQLPDIVPTHYNFKGEVDGYGGKSTLIVLQVVATLLFVGLHMLNKFPHIFNYPVKITPENATIQYQLATRLLRVEAISIALVFGFIPVEILQSIENEKSTLSAIWLFLFLMLVFAPLVVYFFQARKHK
jgi:uncharacterized membrane protein